MCAGSVTCPTSSAPIGACGHAFELKSRINREDGVDFTVRVSEIVWSQTGIESPGSVERALLAILTCGTVRCRPL